MSLYEHPPISESNKGSLITNSSIAELDMYVAIDWCTNSKVEIFKTLNAHSIHYSRRPPHYGQNFHFLSKNYT